MTEFELLQLIRDWSELSATTEATFLTLLFAYLLAAYFVGRALTRTQLYVLTAIYSVAILRTVAAYFRQLSRVLEFGDQLGDLGSSYTLRIPAFAPYVMATIWLVGFGASLFFMRTCRRALPDDQPSAV
jgi:formate hydrogenlyase subunit 3/multisubunit Na+/H+ antiporter MnhD subunit